MSYSLKIIKSFIYEYSTGKAVLNFPWIEMFYKNRGVNHLLSLINQFKLEHFSTVLGYECLNDLIDILSPILSNPGVIDEEKMLGLIRDVVNVISRITVSSFSKDNDSRLRSQQEAYMIRREKMASRNDNDTSTKGFHVSQDDYCNEVLNNWDQEDNSIYKLLKLINNFPKDLIFSAFVKEEEFKKILTFGLICPKNFKLKNTIENFINNNINSINDHSLLIKFNNFLFNTLLDRSTFQIVKEQKNGDGTFFKVLTNLMENHLTLNENSNNIVNFADDLFAYITEYSENSSEVVLEGYMLILRQLVLKNRELAKFLMTKYDIVAEILNKCILSKCHGMKKLII